MRISEPAEYAILGLLQSRPMHGYELFQQFESGALGQIVHLEMSQMYAFMKKLEHLHYIEAQVEAQGVRPPRKVYHLTQMGRDVFFGWLTQPALRPREVRIVFLIKLYFVRRYMPAETARLIERQSTACRRFLAELEARQFPAEQTEDNTFLNTVVVRERIYQTRSLLEWLHELQQDFVQS